MIRSALVLLVLLLLPAAAVPQPREVLVSAATSLDGLLQRLAAMYERKTGEPVVVNFGPSNALARQIAAGAPVDLFVSADERQLDAVRANVVPGSRVALLSNELAIAVPDDRPAALTSVRDLLGPSFKRVAIGDPAGVPAGVYAKTYLTRLGLWARLEPKVIPSGSVRLALAAVENGAADAAIVYRTDVGTARRARMALVIPAVEGPRIVYPAAVLRNGANRAGASRFLAFLQGPEAAAAITAAGFIPLRGVPTP